MESNKIKMCIACNRLHKASVLQCPCGGAEFIGVMLDPKGEEGEEEVEEPARYDSVENYWEDWKNKEEDIDIR